jgi:hypothetical protein
MVYGPPAVGKLTVAKEIVKRTDLRLLDNHATVNAVAPVFGFEHAAFGRLLRVMRQAIMREAAAAEIDLVMTMVYSGARSEPSLAMIDDVMRETDSRLHLLRLTCDRHILDQRVTGDDRVQRGKIASVARLASYIDERESDLPMPGRESLTIDNTNLSPVQVAEAAIAHFGLPTVAGPA